MTSRTLCSTNLASAAMFPDVSSCPTYLSKIPLQGLQTLASLSSRYGRLNFSEQQLEQRTLPHARQWCRRLTRLNFWSQIMQTWKTCKWLLKQDGQSSKCQSEIKLACQKHFYPFLFDPADSRLEALKNNFTSILLFLYKHGRHCYGPLDRRWPRLRLIIVDW